MMSAIVHEWLECAMPKINELLDQYPGRVLQDRSVLILSLNVEVSYDLGEFIEARQELGRLGMPG